MYEPSAGLASRFERWAGAMIDALVNMAIIVPVMLYSGIWQQAMSGEPMDLTQQVLMSAFGFLVFLVLHGYLLATRGQTIGKYLVNTRMVDLDGSIPSFWRMFALRYLVFGLVATIPIVAQVVGLTNIAFIFGKERRCLHDYLAGTRVIKIRKIDVPPVV